MKTLLVLLASLPLAFAGCSRVNEAVVVNHPIEASSGQRLRTVAPLIARYDWQEFDVSLMDPYQYFPAEATISLQGGRKVAPVLVASDDHGKTFQFPLTARLGQDLIFSNAGVPRGTIFTSIEFRWDGAPVQVKTILWRSYMPADMKR